MLKTKLSLLLLQISLRMISYSLLLWQTLQGGMNRCRPVLLSFQWWAQNSITNYWWVTLKVVLVSNHGIVWKMDFRDGQEQCLTINIQGEEEIHWDTHDIIFWCLQVQGTRQGRVWEGELFVAIGNMWCHWDSWGCIICVEQSSD